MALLFIDTWGDGSTEPGDPYLSHFPDIHYNVYVSPAFHLHFIGRYFNACNAIDNHNRMRQSENFLDKYWVTQRSYFILETKVALDMGITYGKLLFCHGISQGSEGKKISFRDYNNTTVYDLFDNPFTAYYLNLPPNNIDDRSRLHKRVRYTPYLLPATIYVSSGNSIGTLTTPSDSPLILLLPSNYPNPPIQ